MRASLQRFLMLCLMLALPLQGYAAATMLTCAHAPGEAATQSMAQAQALPPCHMDTTPDAPPEKHDCAHCAACMLASALPIPMTASMPFDTPPCVYGVSRAGFFAGFIPEGPERPPRSRLA